MRGGSLTECLRKYPWDWPLINHLRILRAPRAADARNYVSPYSSLARIRSAAPSRPPPNRGRNYTEVPSLNEPLDSSLSLFTRRKPVSRLSRHAAETPQGSAENRRRRIQDPHADDNKWDLVVAIRAIT